MHWPLVSRAAYDLAHATIADLRAERDRLLSMVENRLEHQKRIERKEAGLPEREPEKRKPVALSSTVEAACAAWGTMGGQMRAHAVRMLEQGKSEAEVLAALQPGDEP